MSTPDGLRADSERTPKASRAGALHSTLRHARSTPLDVVVQDQSCNLTVGALCSCDADAHPAVSYAFLGLEPIA